MKHSFLIMILVGVSFYIAPEATKSVFRSLINIGSHSASLAAKTVKNIENSSKVSN